MKASIPESGEHPEAESAQAQGLRRLEESYVDICARRAVEAELDARVRARAEQNYESYLNELRRQLLTEGEAGCENARTFHKLSQLEKLEQRTLQINAMKLLRPAAPEEIIGQDAAMQSLVARLSSPYPQHIILYGPPGVGKTSTARLALAIAASRPGSLFAPDAPFVEVDGSSLRFDPREGSNPLLGSVHDPIYQGATRELAVEGIPEPKPGLVTEAHGGVLFIDEIGELDPHLQNQLLKVMEDKRVHLDSSYFDPSNERIPQYIKKIFTDGLPADFLLIGATTRERGSISPAFRSRCAEVWFEALPPQAIRRILTISARKLKMKPEPAAVEQILAYCCDGRSANKVLLDACALALLEQEQPRLPVKVSAAHVQKALQSSRIHPPMPRRDHGRPCAGRICGLGVSGQQGNIIEIEALAFPMPKGQGSLRFNEAAGSMARDSVFNAGTALRCLNGIDPADYDLHINITGGGQVDGPSAGLAIYLALYSAITGIPLRQDVAVSGEISIRGELRPVGGINQKIAAARQARLAAVLLPVDNLSEMPPESPDLPIIAAADTTACWEYMTAPA
ncbi:MAG: Lon family ATP-dependent protease [Syntrophomonadaceae bacterium]|nr:Lon family ATP-dependent protease [Syntrophomonadaceae bacterium]